MSIESDKTIRQPKSMLARLVGRLRRDEEGVTAIEFGIIAAPFLILIVALLETALVHLTTLDLENAVRDASRQIRTGQAQVANLSANQFKDLVCDNTVLISDCKTTEQLVIDVRSYDDFDIISTDPAEMHDDDGVFTGDNEYSLGSGLKVVVVRAYYKMKLLAQLPIVGLANAGPHHRMINAISVFRNEPF
ncbi:MAG: pilus assembly protein [bacterium]|nr:pilus assembly protein [bacterium]